MKGPFGEDDLGLIFFLSKSHNFLKKKFFLALIKFDLKNWVYLSDKVSVILRYNEEPLWCGPYINTKYLLKAT